MENTYINRRYIIFDMSEIDKVNFDEVLEGSVNTIRKSTDNTKTFIKYNLPQPKFVQELITKSIEYTHEEILQILNTSEWILSTY